MEPDRELVNEQLDRIFSNPPFSTGRRLKALLKYLIDADRRGDAERIKGYAIGLDVFGRDSSFDPGADPIVRVQAARLRAALDTYYGSVGRHETLRISIPKGCYKVKYSRVTPEPSASENPALLRSRTLSAGYKCAPDEFLSEAITVGVLPFSAHGDGEGRTDFAGNLVQCVTAKLARIGSLSVTPVTSMLQFRGSHDLRTVGRMLGVRYLVDGSIHSSGNRKRITIHLVDSVTNQQLWAETYERDVKDRFALPDELGTLIAREARGRLYLATSNLLERQGGRPQTAWQLFMRALFTPGGGVNSLQTELDRVALARRALELDPNSARARSVISEKLSYLANVDPESDTEEARREAVEQGRIAWDLDPSDSDVIFNIAVSHWHAGRFDESMNATRRTLELEPTHPLASFLVEVVSYANTCAPPDIISNLVDFEGTLSRDNPVRWVALNWISRLHFNNADYAAAERFGRLTHQIYKTPETRYLLAAVKVQLGKVARARSLIHEARQDWPTYDLHYYADIVIPRRYGSGAVARRLHRDYKALAIACD